MWSRRLFPGLRYSLGISLLTVACHGVVSLDPAIGPNDAVAVPAIVGDWYNIQDDDSTLARVGAADDSTSYWLELGEPMVIGGVSLGAAEFELRLAPMGDDYLAEAIPAESAERIDSLAWGYGATVQRAYIAGKLKIVRRDVRVWLFQVDSVRNVLHAGRCPLPGRAIDRHGDLIFGGGSAEVRRTVDCLMMIPGVLGEPVVYRRAPT